MSPQADLSGDMPDFDGLRVQIPGEHQIWLVFGDRRHYITDIAVMRSIFRNDAFRTETDCARLPEGSVLGPGSRLVRGSGSTSVHLVVCSHPGQETRHLVVDEAQFEHYGFNAEKIVEISPEMLRNIPVGLPLGPLATALAMAERYSLERLAEGLQPNRPTLLLLLEERNRFAEQFATHLQESVRRRANILFGWLEDGELAVSSASPDTAGSVTTRLPDEDLALAALTLRIDRVDLLATEFKPAARAVIAAIGCAFDLTPLAAPPAPGSTDAAATAEFRALVQQAARIITCSDTMVAALRAWLPGRPITIGLDPEAGKPNLFRVHPARLDLDEELRVLIWNGALEPENQLVAEAVAACCDDQAAVRFYSLDGTPTACSPAGLRHLGPANRLDLNKLVCVLRPHLVWFPSPAPEVFDFRVSAAMAQGLPILAGAACGLGLRLDGRPYTWILPMNATPVTVRSELTAIRTRWAAEYSRLRRTEAAPSFYPGAYLTWDAPTTSDHAEPMPVLGDGAEFAPAPLAPQVAATLQPVKKRWRLFR